MLPENAYIIDGKCTCRYAFKIVLGNNVVPGKSFKKDLFFSRILFSQAKEVAFKLFQNPNERRPSVYFILVNLMAY